MYLLTYQPAQNKTNDLCNPTIINLMQKEWFWGYAPKRDNTTKNNCATKTPLVYSECVIKEGDGGHFSSSLNADMLTSETNKRMRISVKIV